MAVGQLNKYLISFMERKPAHFTSFKAYFEAGVGLCRGKKWGLAASQKPILCRAFYNTNKCCAILQL
jgi:hypothetical protein